MRKLLLIASGILSFLFTEAQAATVVSVSNEFEPNDWYQTFDASPIHVIEGESLGSGPFGEFRAFTPVEFSFAPTDHLSLAIAVIDPRFSAIWEVTWQFDHPTSELEIPAMPVDWFAAVPRSQFDIAPGTPEMSTWAMLMTGFTALGFTAYRRNRMERAIAI